MSNLNLRELLLQTPLPDGKPAFERSKDIVNAVAEVFLANGQTRDSQGIGSQISAIFVNRRTCPPALRNTLLEATRKVFAGRGYPDHKMISEIEGAISAHNAAFEGLAQKRAEADETPEEVRRILDLFERLSGKESLLIVEYRDLPRTYPRGKYENLLTPVAMAILEGLHMAMMQPFQSEANPPWGPIDSKTNGGFSQARDIKHYLTSVFERARLTYTTISRKIDEIGTERKLSPEKIGEAQKRLRLYERNSKCAQAPAVFISGIQTRILYAVYPENNALYAPRIEEVWEWVAGEDRDYFIKRELSIAPIISQQFFQVLQFWDKHESLPQTTADMNSVSEDPILGAKLPKDVWLARDPKDL